MIVTIKKKLGKKIVNEEVRAAGLIPVLAYCEEEHFFLMDDQSVGFCFMCEPLCGADEKIQERTNGFINQEFPTGSSMQFLLFRSPDINAQMYRMLGLRDNFKHETLTPILKERTEFLQHHTRERLVTTVGRGIYDNGLIQDTKLVVSFKMPISNTTPTEKELMLLKELHTKVQSSLQTIRARPRVMTADDYIRFIGTVLNWGDDASWRTDSTSWENDKPICEQIFDYGTDIEVSKDGLRLGDYHAKVLSAKKMPDIYFFGDAMSFIGDLTGGGSGVKENYMVVTNLFFPDPVKTKHALERKRQFTINQAVGPMLKFAPVLAEKKACFDMLYESMNEGAKPIRVSYSMVLFAPTKDRVEAASMAIQNIWREQRFKMLEDKFVSLPMFLNCLPLCTDREAVKDLFRYKTMTTKEATVLLPIFGEWKGTGTYHAALVSRNGQLMSLSLHDSPTNKNLVIAAESGSGKSFLTNELICSYLSEGALVWVIDAGKSYQKLAELLKGDFLHFAEDTDVCLSPFELIHNYEDEEDAIVSLVASMASAKGLLDEWQIAGLKQVMTKLWEEKARDMKVDDIAQRCLEGEDQRLKDIGNQLYAFTSKGSYGRYFAHKNNVNFKNQFTVLELDELQGRKHLRQVVLLQLIYQIQQEVFLGERNRKKIVIVDEAWDLLKEGEVSVFMEHAYRKFRKYRGSVIIATQSVNDLYENKVGRAIAENSANMYLLGQTEETVDSIKESKRLSMSDGAFNTLRTVHTAAGAYSELFVKSKTGLGVGRLIVSDFQKLLYSTDPEEVNEIEQRVRLGMTVPEAINDILRCREEALKAPARRA